MLCRVTTPPGTSDSWQCRSCGREHRGLAFAFGTPAPAPWEVATEAERQQGEINADVCVLPDRDGVHHYLRGRIELPVLDLAGEVFVWDTWVSLSEANMRLQVEHWDDPRREKLDPMFAWVCTALPYEPPTVGLAANLHTRAPGLAPWIELDPTSPHPLAVEQRQGITVHRVSQFNAQLLDRGGDPA